MRKQTALAALVLISLLSGCFPTGELSSALDEPFSKNSDVDFKPVLNNKEIEAKDKEISRLNTLLEKAL